MHNVFKGFLHFYTAVVRERTFINQADDVQVEEPGRETSLPCEEKLSDEHTEVPMAFGGK